MFQRTVSLYAKDDRTVRVEVLDDEGAVRLIVCGPGAARRSLGFADEPSLLKFQRDLEEELAGEGFQMIARAERRSGTDRRAGHNRPPHKRPDPGSLIPDP